MPPFARSNARSADAALFEPLEARQLLAAEITSFTATPQIIAPGELVTLEARVTGGTGGVKAVTFFLDRDNNGRWTRGFDESLRDVFAPVPGDPTLYRAVVASNITWPANARLAADVVDNANVWSTGGPETDSIDVKPHVFITDLAVEFVAGNFYKVSARIGKEGESNPPFSSTAGVTFYVDRNNDGRWTPGVDTHLDFITTPDAAGIYTNIVQVPLPWDAPQRVIAAAKDTRAAGNPWGPNRAAIPRITLGNMPEVVGLTVTVNNPKVPGAITVGETATITAQVSANFGIEAISFFYDKNGDGLWTPGVDVNLGQRFDNGFNTTGTYQITIPVTEAFLRGVQSIAAVAKDSSVRGNDNWGPPRQIQVRVARAPTVSNPQASPLIVPNGGVVTINVAARDDFGIRAVTAFLDVNQNDRFDPGVDNVSPGFGTRISGLATDGVWRLTITANVFITPATYKIYIATVDFQGLWSTRVLTTINVV